QSAGATLSFRQRQDPSSRRERRQRHGLEFRFDPPAVSKPPQPLGRTLRELAERHCAVEVAPGTCRANIHSRAVPTAMPQLASSAPAKTNMALTIAGSAAPSNAYCSHTTKT